MPFTLSHPAIVVPLRRCGLVLSALVVGSMAPDFGFYVSFGPLGDRSHHNFTDLFTFCLPAGLIALWAFHRVLKQPLLSLLPLQLQSRLQPYSQPFLFGPWNRFLLIVASLLAGAMAHLVWDFFCHTPGWRGWPLEFLTTTIISSTVVGDIRVVEVIHVLFSVAGLAFLAAQAGRALLSTRSPCVASRPLPPHPHANPGLLGVGLFLALAVAAVFAAAAGSLFLAHPFSDEQVRRLAVYHTAVLSVTFLFAELLFVSVALMVRPRVVARLARLTATCGPSARGRLLSGFVSMISGNDSAPSTALPAPGSFRPGVHTQGKGGGTETNRSEVKP